MSAPFYNDQALTAITKAVAKRTAEIVAAADNEATEGGKGWYYVAHEIATELSEAAYDAGNAYSVAQCSAVIAVLSPQTRWWQNLQAAEDVIVGNPDAALSHCYPRNVAKALAILRGDASVLSGPKVTAFHNVILDPSHCDDVVIDTWMLKAYGLDWQDYGRKGVYDAVADGVRKAADSLGLRPHQAQAIVWIATRGKVA